MFPAAMVKCDGDWDPAEDPSCCRTSVTPNPNEQVEYVGALRPCQSGCTRSNEIHDIHLH